MATSRQMQSWKPRATLARSRIPSLLSVRPSTDHSLPRTRPHFICNTNAAPLRSRHLPPPPPPPAELAPWQIAIMRQKRERQPASDFLQRIPFSVPTLKLHSIMWKGRRVASVGRVMSRGRVCRSVRPWPWSWPVHPSVVLFLSTSVIGSGRGFDFSVAMRRRQPHTSFFRYSIRVPQLSNRLSPSRLSKFPFSPNGDGNCDRRPTARAGSKWRGGSLLLSSLFFSSQAILVLVSVWLAFSHSSPYLLREGGKMEGRARSDPCFPIKPALFLWRALSNLKSVVIKDTHLVLSRVILHPTKT